jgi:uncharacterized protein YdeI (YjbR/CyaY-like superfamily)
LQAALRHLSRLAQRKCAAGGAVPRNDPRVDAYITKAQPFARPMMPPALRAAQAKAPKAKAFFATPPPGHQREYLLWVTEAKTDATRDKRIATAIEWLSEGKHRNWKYERK